ncbi:uncharacterized protein [Mycetomoellerius zeteki]|uniref:uncharacterized protein n=1 Tax=Mycetomoellerius zeteki TaxID=64791 RepID=UPI00084EBFC5|nr:PREDICTED: uncharacterized protein LOC108729541 [Trachymyrmex zeteki]
MEPDVVKDIVTSSTILQSKNLEIGVLIGDDDSSTIAACRAASSHTIVKHSDINHASGGVKKELYKIEKRHKELTKDGILYLHRCFTYALAQNKGNSAALADAIQCIPYHAFNDHSKCGTWCGYIIDKENYDHRIIPGGFHDFQLFESLREIFDKLASNAQKFSAGASSNANESLNAIMASKAPKSRCYSMLESADFRFACAIGQKNIGEDYTQKVVTSLGLSPGKFHSRHISKINHTVKCRRRLIKNPTFKKNRLVLKKRSSALRHRIENREGVTYEGNCALFNTHAVEDEPEPEHSSIEEESNKMPPIILVDLETFGFGRGCDILQIAAKCGSLTFETYVNPTQQISSSATSANGLTNNFGELMYHGVQVSSVPLRVAMGNFHSWLSSFEQKSYIATHNLSFDGPRIYDAITSCSLQSDFSEVVHGFIDTLYVIRKHTGRKGKGECTITGLAEWLNVSSANTHNAIYDVEILHKILKKYFGHCIMSSNSPPTEALKPISKKF